jgi:MoxR-like ATPase
MRPARPSVARQRPIVIITSNNEKELPDAFLRRCFFHYIRFPDMETLQRIVDVHYPGIKQTLVREALTQFYEIRETAGLKKKPSTSEALDWIRLLVADDVEPETCAGTPRTRCLNCTVRCSRTSRTCIFSSGWHFWQGSAAISSCR